MKPLLRRSKSPPPEHTVTPRGELRQDITTGNWVVIATGRAKRPHDLASERPKKKALPKYKDDCPFCNTATFPQLPDVLRLPDDPEKWQVHIFGNKYPAFMPKDDFRLWEEGPHRAMEAVGYHELLATRQHNVVDGLATQQQLSWQLEALVLRYRQLRIKPSVNYIQIIKNHGPAAGGSLEHPHHQIFTTPVMPNDVRAMLYEAERYAQKHGEEAFAVLLDYERAEQKRIVWENDYFTAFCPFASRVPFETWIMPRQVDPFFENMGPHERASLAEIMQQIFSRLYTGLNDPPYNYFIHSAPCDDTGFVCDKEQFKHFRWHIEIMPRLNILGGFELGTGLEINTTSPEEAAAFLREQKLPHQ
jgi:UDPglucose--hexose-1-phosphate uridylyltransferase